MQIPDLQPPAAPRRMASHGIAWRVVRRGAAMVIDAQPLISIEWRLKAHGSDRETQSDQRLMRSGYGGRSRQPGTSIILPASRCRQVQLWGVWSELYR